MAPIYQIRIQIYDGAYKPFSLTPINVKMPRVTAEGAAAIRSEFTAVARDGRVYNRWSCKHCSHTLADNIVRLRLHLQKCRYYRGPIPESSQPQQRTDQSKHQLDLALAEVMLKEGKPFTWLGK